VGEAVDMKAKSKIYINNFEIKRPNEIWFGGRKIGSFYYSSIMLSVGIYDWPGGGYIGKREGGVSAEEQVLKWLRENESKIKNTS
jgi:hypothetical protein